MRKEISTPYFLDIHPSTSFLLHPTSFLQRVVQKPEKRYPPKEFRYPLLLWRYPLRRPLPSFFASILLKNVTQAFSQNCKKLFYDYRPQKRQKEISTQWTCPHLVEGCGGLVDVSFCKFACNTPQCYLLHFLLLLPIKKAYLWGIYIHVCTSMILYIDVV